MPTTEVFGYYCNSQLKWRQIAGINSPTRLLRQVLSHHLKELLVRGGWRVRAHRNLAMHPQQGFPQKRALLRCATSIWMNPWLPVPLIPMHAFRTLLNFTFFTSYNADCVTCYRSEQLRCGRLARLEWGWCRRLRRSVCSTNCCWRRSRRRGMTGRWSSTRGTQPGDMGGMPQWAWMPRCHSLDSQTRSPLHCSNHLPFTASTTHCSSDISNPLKNHSLFIEPGFCQTPTASKQANSVSDIRYHDNRP